MGLTPEEAAELRRLEIEQQQADDVARGREFVAKAQAARQAGQIARASEFSLQRVVIGGLRDAAQGLINTYEDVRDENAGLFGGGWQGQSIARVVSTTPLGLGMGLGAGIVGFKPDTSGEKFVLPDYSATPHAGAAEQFARGAVSFIAPFGAFSKAFGVARATTLLGRTGLSLLAGAATDFTQLDPVAGNAANFIKDTFGIKSDVLDALVADPDDSGLEERFKAAVAGAGLGIFGDAVLETGAKAARMYKSIRVSQAEAEGIVAAAKADYALKESARNLAEPLEEAPPAAAGAKKGTKKAAQADTTQTAAPSLPDDVVSSLAKRVEADVLEPTDAAKAAAKELWDNPENALGKLGIDPAKIDFSKLEDEDSLQLFFAKIADLYAGPVATKLGRTGVRVSEETTAKAAKALGVSPEVLIGLYGKTSNLDANLMAGRILVASHGHQMLSLGDAAMTELKAGGAGPAWDEFIRAFHRQAYFQGAVTGAASEVGRALRSLQFLPKAEGQKAAEQALKAAGSEAQQTIRKSQIAAGASVLTDRLVTDAEKIIFLSEIKKLGGDVGELSRRVRAETSTFGGRVSAVVRETVGTLFSPGTAVLNIASGGLMMGEKALNKALVAIGKSALSPGSKAARIARLDAWAYVDGILSGFGSAAKATLDLLEHEGLAEAAINLDGLGLKELARKAATQASDAGSRLTGHNYERVDLPSQRAISLPAAASRRADEFIKANVGHKVWQDSLTAIMRLVRPAVNAAGSGYRAGTMLFINAPDQFVGTLATRAGAYSQAVKAAAEEAAQLELEGPALTKFIKAKVAQDMAGLPLMSADDPLREGARWAASMAGDVERKRVLFQDELETDINRKISGWLSNHSESSSIGGAVISYVVPFIRTPLRILERTTIDYTPLGLLSDRYRAAIAAGGAEREEALVRTSLGTLAMVMGYMLAEDRDIVGSDGGYDSTARAAGREMYSLKIGGDTVEFSRLDPLGTLLGIGADLRQYQQSLEGHPNREEMVWEAMSAVGLAFSANILNKTYLTSLKNITELAGGGPDPEDSTPGAWAKFVGGMADRFVPAAGIQKQVNASSDPFIRDARTFLEKATKASVGAPTLPPMRDAIGRTMEPTSGRSLGGFPIDTGSDDPLDKELEALAFDMQKPSRSIEGVDLTAAQYSRYLELRGQVVKDSSGMTMEENLRDLISQPGWETAPRAVKVDAMREVMRGYARLAKDQMIREDKDFAYRMLRSETFATLEHQGKGLPEKEAEVARLAKELGLTPTE